MSSSLKRVLKKPAWKCSFTDGIIPQSMGCITALTLKDKSFAIMRPLSIHCTGIRMYIV
jgi:hypothetical protein